MLLNSNQSMMPAVNTVAATMSPVTTPAMVKMQSKIAQIKMYTNYSPCSTCSNKLINFISQYKMQNIIVELEIIAASPYKCTRVSCDYCSKPKNLRNLNIYATDFNYKLKSVIYANNTQGLRTLMATPGVILRGFELADWLYLASKLNIAMSLYNYSVKFLGVPGKPNHFDPQGCVRRDSRHEADNATILDFTAIRNYPLV